MDQAVNFFGSHVEVELDKASHKQTSKDRAAQQKRQRKLEQLLDPNPEKPKKGQYMDPAAFFS